MPELRTDEAADGQAAGQQSGEPAHWENRRGTPGQHWTLSQSRRGLELTDARGVVLLDPERAHLLTTSTGVFRTYLSVAGDPARQRLRVPSRRAGRAIRQAVADVGAFHSLRPHLDAVTAWHSRVRASLERAVIEVRWLPEEALTALVHARPALPGAEPHVTAIRHLLTGEERMALDLSAGGVRELARQTNADVERLTFQEHGDFFRRVESSPLTEEQARAVLTMDNRVQVVAAAGSGKTSVMVGRATYAVHRGFIEPEHILLLAFNRAAAAELRDRVVRRFAAVGLDGSAVRTTTFHAFGLDVIGQATGRRPTVAPWVVDGREQSVIEEIVDQLRTSDPAFAAEWDLFRLLYGRPVETGPDTSPDPDLAEGTLRTFKGDLVRSEGERLIADHLYLHHVDYEYERPYVVPTADSHHRQYHPDFYYPAADLWHEHWGVDAHGQPPPGWTGYLDSMRWKQDLHRRHRTTLLETTWHGLMRGDDLDRLEAKLRGHGVTLSFDPGRVPVGAEPLKSAALTRLVRTFMRHVKANALTEDAVADRLTSIAPAQQNRSRRFLRLYWRIHHEWQERLRAGGYVDFEDMLVQAGDHIAAGRYRSPFGLVMVDEFQDASQARARLTRALVDQPGRYLLTVGDDWQSINRFAGADISVMRHFHDYFGAGPTLHLSTTFRCHQAVSDVATRFVRKNPAQLDKDVTSVRTGAPDPAAHEGVQLLPVEDLQDVPAALTQFLTALDATCAPPAPTDDRSGPAGRTAPAAGTGQRGQPRRTVSVDVLGRYRHDDQLMPSRRFDNLRVTFRTIHSAKGLEADYVVVPNLTDGTYGFPSRITDDPLLALAMSEAEPYPNAEERRLLFVALTRARRGVVLFAPTSEPSPFVTELAEDPLVRVHPGRTRTGAAGKPCPRCRIGRMRPRTGPYGPFYGCSGYPACKETLPVDTAPATA